MLLWLEDRGEHGTMTDSLESEIVETEWTDKDYDYIVDYIIDKKLGLKNVDELKYD